MNLKPVIAVAALAALLWPVSAANAAKAPRRKPAGPTAAQKKDAAVEKEITADRDEVQKDRDALEAIAARLRPKLESSPDYLSAIAASAKAQAEYNDAYNQFIAELMTHQDYKDAVAAKAAAQAKGDAVRKDPNSTPDDVSAAAKDVLAAANNVTRIQNTALEGDTHLASLKASAADAAEKVASMKKAIDAKVTSDPSFVAAKSTLDQAQAKLDAARKKLG